MVEKIRIDIDECTGCEACVETCPEVFGFDSENEKAFLIETGDYSEACVDEAIDGCPVECITREEL